MIFDLVHTFETAKLIGTINIKQLSFAQVNFIWNQSEKEKVSTFPQKGGELNMTLAIKARV